MCGNMTWKEIESSIPVTQRDKCKRVKTWCNMSHWGGANSSVSGMERKRLDMKLGGWALMISRSMLCPTQAITFILTSGGERFWVGDDLVRMSSHQDRRGGITKSVQSWVTGRWEQESDYEISVKAHKKKDA